MMHDDYRFKYLKETVLMQLKTAKPQHKYIKNNPVYHHVTVRKRRICSVFFIFTLCFYFMASKATTNIIFICNINYILSQLN